VLEPQGKAIQLSLAEKGSHEFSLVRVGKYIEVELEAESEEAAKQKMDKIAGDMLYKMSWKLARSTSRKRNK
jgi:phosphoribosylformylglycinamidine synthase